MGFGSIKINLNKGKAKVSKFPDVLENSNIQVKGDDEKVVSCLVSILIEKRPGYRERLLKQLGIKDE